MCSPEMKNSPTRSSPFKPIYSPFSHFSLFSKSNHHIHLPYPFSHVVFLHSLLSPSFYFEFLFSLRLQSLSTTFSAFLSPRLGLLCRSCRILCVVHCSLKTCRISFVIRRKLSIFMQLLISKTRCLLSFVTLRSFEFVRKLA